MELVTETNALFYNNKKELKYDSPIPRRLGNITVIIDNNDNVPVIYGEKLDPNVNEKLRNKAQEIKMDKDSRYMFNIRGDILDVTMKMEMGEATFMLDISRGEAVEFKDIFTEENMEEILIKKTSYKDKDVKIIGFVLDDNLSLSIKDGEKIVNEVIPYEEIEPYINKNGGLFFKSVLAPSVNLESR